MSRPTTNNGLGLMNSVKLLGVVLAGGRSSRMGQDKSELAFADSNMLDVMINKLELSGLTNILVSGRKHQKYDSIADDTSYTGPLGGIRSTLAQRPGYAGYIFLPTDMPLLPPTLLTSLGHSTQATFFTNHPLPCFIPGQISIPLHLKSIKDLLEYLKAKPVAIPERLSQGFLNLNDPESYQYALLVQQSLQSKGQKK